MASLRHADELNEGWDLNKVVFFKSELLDVQPFPDNHAVKYSLEDLRKLVAKQKVALEKQQELLAAGEMRLKYMQQQEASKQTDLALEQARLQRIGDCVETQEHKLKTLRAWQRQVDTCRNCSDSSNSELETVRALFTEKEKELAIAVAKVDSLLRQLQDLKDSQQLTRSDRLRWHRQLPLAAELENLHNDLQHRKTLRERKNMHLQSRQEELLKKKDEVTMMDNRIMELKNRLKKQQEQQLTFHFREQRGDLKGDVTVVNETATLPPTVARTFRHNAASIQPSVQCDNICKTVSVLSSTVSQDAKSIYDCPCSESKHGNIIKKEHGEVNNNTAILNRNNRNRILDAILRKSTHSTVADTIPPIVMSHFDARRLVGAYNNKQALFGNQNSITKCYPSESNTSSIDPVSLGGSGLHETSKHATQATNISSKTLVWHTNMSTKSRLPRWPPEPEKLFIDTNKTELVLGNKSLPQMKVLSEERQDGSGQSSPASSELPSPSLRQSIATSSQCFLAALPMTRGQAVSKAILPTAAIIRNTALCHSTTSGTSAGVLPVSSVMTKSDRRLQRSGHCIPSTTGVEIKHQQDMNHHQPIITDSGRQGSVDASHCALTKRENGCPASNVSHTVVSSVKSVMMGTQLNQRPIPTYRYASKSVIGNTYMGRLGNAAMERYHEVNKQLYKADSVDNGDSTTSTTSPSTSGQCALECKLNQAVSDLIPATTVNGNAGESVTHFGLVGLPIYRDIASDKGSYKPNTPRHVRRRQSDSDGEDSSKALQRVGLNYLPVSVGNIVGDEVHHVINDEKKHELDERVDIQRLSDRQDAKLINGSIVPKDSDRSDDIYFYNASDDKKDVDCQQLNVSEREDTAGSTFLHNGVPSPHSSDMKTRNPILKGVNSRKSWNRVSFNPLALLLDACLEGELELVKFTATQVKDVSLPNDEGITPLHNAVCAGHFDIVCFLVEFGADVNSADSDGWTPLHCAASCNNLPMVQQLVEHGACIYATTISDNETAAEKCEEGEDDFDSCSTFLFGVQKKLGVTNDGIVYAVFDYTAKKEDELTLHINDRITILRIGDDTEVEWWWSSNLNGKQSYVPRNLLALYPRVLPSNYIDVVSSTS